MGFAAAGLKMHRSLSLSLTSAINREAESGRLEACPPLDGLIC